MFMTIPGGLITFFCMDEEMEAQTNSDYKKILKLGCSFLLHPIISPEMNILNVVKALSCLPSLHSHRTSHV